MKRSEVFRDADVARAYQYRPVYPPQTFEILAKLMVEPRAVLDVGAGTGAVARELLPYADRIDAVDPSSAMVQQGRLLPGGDDPRLRWIVETAENARLDPPYGLITAGASLHWLDLPRVMPLFGAALAPGGKLAVLEVVDSPVEPAPWADPVTAIVRRYSELDVPVVDTTGDVLAELDKAALWHRDGETLTSSVRSTLTVDGWLEWLHSTSTHARVRLGDRAARFDTEIRELFARLGRTQLDFAVQGRVVWGRPVTP